MTVADPSERPYPPGEYPIVVVGSGPGALQTSYFLGRLGIEHALLSADPGPGGHLAKPFHRSGDEVFGSVARKFVPIHPVKV